MIDDNEWTPATTAWPQRISLSDEQMETVRADLWRIGITTDIFQMDGLKRLEFLNSSQRVAIAVYAAVLHATQGEYQLTQSFKQWARALGLKWGFSIQGEG